MRGEVFSTQVSGCAGFGGIVLLPAPGIGHLSGFAGTRYYVPDVLPEVRPELEATCASGNPRAAISRGFSETFALGAPSNRVNETIRTRRIGKGVMKMNTEKKMNWANKAAKAMLVAAAVVVFFIYPMMTTMTAAAVLAVYAYKVYARRGGYSVACSVPSGPAAPTKAEVMNSWVALF